MKKNILILIAILLTLNVSTSYANDKKESSIIEIKSYKNFKWIFYQSPLKLQFYVINYDIYILKRFIDLVI